MDDRKEKVVALISKLIDRFYHTPDRFFVALAETLIERKYTDSQIKTMVDHTINTVTKTQLTVADVIGDSYNQKQYEYL